jgi:outer membrane protein OmpA-like peptidoglycan-associated protein
MKTKIRVYGKDQNRTALGIVNAYLALNPGATLEDLQKAFPYSLNPTGTVKETIAPISETLGKTGEFFEKPDEVITLKNGQKVVLKYLWEKPNFEKIKEHAEEFGIEVVEVVETAPFKEGSYRLEVVEEKPVTHHHEHHAAPGCGVEGVIVEEVIPVEEVIVVEELEKPKHQVTHQAQHVHKEPIQQPVKKVYDEPEKKKTNWWWLLIPLLLLLLGLLCWKKCSEDKKPAPVIEVPFTDTEKVEVYEPYWDKRVADATINAAGELLYNKAGEPVGILIDNETIQFDKLSTEAEIYHFLRSDQQESGWIVLDDIHFKFNEVNFSPAALAQIQHVTSILKAYAPNATIALEGFADHIGTAAENQKISDERATATKDHFVTDGFEAGKVTSAQGLRDTQRLCQADDTPVCRALNRRVEIKITK